MLTNADYQRLPIADLTRLLDAEERINAAFSSDKSLRRENDAFFRLSITPLVLTSQQLTSLETMSRLLFSALQKITTSIIARGEYDDRWAQHSDFASLNAAKRRFTAPIFLARLDAMLDEDGQFKVMEFNPASPVGVCFFHHWRRFPLCAFPWHALRPEMSRFPFDDPYFFVRTLIEIAATRYGARRPLNVVLANDNAKLTLELPLMERCFADLGHRASIQCLDQLSLKGDRLCDRLGDAVDLVYYKARAARSSQRGWWPDQLQHYKGFLTAYENDLTCIFNPLPGHTIAEDKAMLAYMRRGDFNGILTEEERAAIRTNIPDTYVSGDANAVQQQDFLVKPRCGSRGQRIRFGKSCPAADWARLINCKDFVIQRVIRGKPQLIPVIKNERPELVSMTQTISIFVMEGEPMGVWSRVSATDLHNAAAGGSIQPVVVS